MKERRTCRCCDSPNLVGYGGLCQSCTDAVSRFLTLRRRNLRNFIAGTNSKS